LRNSAEGSQALLGITSVLLKEFLDEPFQNRTVIGRQGPLAFQDLGQSPGLVVDPSVKAGDELFAC
jgi:hypothetical protein